MSELNTAREFWKVVEASDQREEEMLIASFDPGLVAVAEYVVNGKGQLSNSDFDSVVEAIAHQRGWDLESAQEVASMCFERVEREAQNEQA